MNFAYSWVPRGSMLSTYSAPTIACKNALLLRLMVEKNTHPPGLTKVLQAATIQRASIATPTSAALLIEINRIAPIDAVARNDLPVRLEDYGKRAFHGADLRQRGRATACRRVATCVAWTPRGVG